MKKSFVFRPPYSGFASRLRLEVAALGLPTILCIGSDRLTGDCLGPLVGEFLTETYNVPCFVYGTLTRTVTALNLRQTLSFVKSRHPASPLVVIDASLGDPSDIGNIRITRGGIRPGSAGGKSFAPCGDLALTAVVNGMPCESLSSTRLGFVKDLSHVIATALASAVFSCEVKPSLPDCIA